MSQYRQGPANRRQPPPAPQRPAAKPPAPQKKKTSSHRITTGLVALSSGAILSVYALGYARTQEASAQVSGQDSSTAAMPTVAGPLPRVAAVVPGATATAGATTPAQSTSGAQPTAHPTATATPAPKTGTYKDGTYTGSGTSRHGGVDVSVVVQGGKIVSANVSRCQTRYPCSYITSLASQVVSRQGPPVNLISGATDSSTAYKQAVTSALSNAT